MVITRAELESYRGQTLPDLVGPGLRLLFVGINPGLRAVAVGAPFGGGSNRFYPALFRAGITRAPIVASRGLSAEDRSELQQRGVGITSLVARASARADELDDAELVEGAVLLAAYRDVAIAAGIAVYDPPR
ncbi:mismatch-specific DNA-glycosylase [Subtercola lobariae]|uniref:Uracil-DNA glycosylase-like domain-containing protein n=1 Tax=Subtercola lobariae TaxID=1588641 RepID=A0A917EXW7_9MICO|nr:mismatch-specific DNA-glycosylase [Subtercola lobariae]GGF30437.1 hypothetical protein GCM10011399_24560 [Subtercola lobariae]